MDGTGKALGTVVVLGASSHPEKYSNKAVKSLLEAGWRVIPVNPAGGQVHGLEVAKELPSPGADIHTVTFYVNAKNSSAMAKALLELKPRRAIFNPGAENEKLMKKLSAAGIETLEACTLVMLLTGQF